VQKGARPDIAMADLRVFYAPASARVGELKNYRDEALMVSRLNVA
jgi:hypothetical protein